MEKENNAVGSIKVLSISLCVLTIIILVIASFSGKSIQNLQSAAKEITNFELSQNSDIIRRKFRKMIYERFGNKI